jgi:hypothetical protein
MEKFKIHAYGFQELALVYFPDSRPATASSLLRKWIRLRPLIDKLKEAHYRSGQKILTPRQVEIIVEHVGEP